VRKIDAKTSSITTIAGTGMRGSSMNGVPAKTAALTDPQGVALDGQGHLLIADRGDACVRIVDFATGMIGTLAGNGMHGSGGDHGAAKDAELEPTDVVAGVANAIYVSDAANHRVRHIDPISPV